MSTERWTTVRTLVFALTLLLMLPLLPGVRSAASAQAPQGASQAELRAIAERVAVSLLRSGIPPQYVPGLTEEYVGAFQLSLLRGATRAQADLIASRHVFAIIQNAVASAQPGGGGGNGGDWMRRTPGGNVGGDGQCTYFNDPSTGASVMTGC